MARYLRTGYYETVLPVRLGTLTGNLRVWLNIGALVPLLQRLDEIYGAPGQPYAVRPEERLDAMKTLDTMIKDLIIEHPEVVKRASVGERMAQELTIQYGVRRADIHPVPPPWLDQVDLEIADLIPLYRILFRPALQG